MNDFVLSAATGRDATQTFVRGESDLADNPWVFTEVIPAGSDEIGLFPADCVAVTATGQPGSSAIQASQSGEVRIGLVAGETVTCTYNNARSGGIGIVEKETLGGVGTFDIDLIPPPGAPPIVTAPVTTTRPGVPVMVVGPAATVTGTYTVIERKPVPDGRGTWELTSVICNDQFVPFEDDGDSWSASHEVTAGENPRCLITNTFTPGGSISVEKVTRGGTGTFGYSVVPRLSTTGEWAGDMGGRGTATTTAEDTPTPAVRDDGLPGPLADELVVDGTRHTVIEYVPPATDAGHWELTDVDCGGAEVDFPAPGAVDIVLTPQNPNPTCRFTNDFVPVGTLDVIKNTSGDPTLRPEPAQVELDCVDGTTGQATVAPGESSGSVPRRGFNDVTECTVTEPETGAAANAEVTTTATLTVDDRDPSAIELGVPFTVRPGEETVVVIDNVFTEPTAPETGTPPTHPTNPTNPTAPTVPAHPTSGPLPPTIGSPGAPMPPGSGGPSNLATTGQDTWWLFPSVIMAGTLLVAGAVMVRTARRSRCAH